MKFGTIKRFINFRKVLIQALQILVGTAIMSAATIFFLLPNQISVGGFSGVATIPYYLFKIPIGITIIVLNIPLFVIAFIKSGKKYFINAVFGTVVLSIFLNLFENFKPLTNDRLLASIYGGILSGIGNAIVLKSGGSTGGTDLLAKIVQSFKPDSKRSSMIVIFDTIVIALNVLFFKEIEVALYSVVSIYVVGKILDVFFEGIDFSKMIYIISPKHQEIAEKIGAEIERGVTYFYGKGSHTGEEKEVLFCVASRGEVGQIRKIVKSLDPGAFVVISNAREVFGEGFKEE
jgi:uncharacterized membrane-anchored protein YitT (DUF2179 family)